MEMSVALESLPFLAAQEQPLGATSAGFPRKFGGKGIAGGACVQGCRVPQQVRVFFSLPPLSHSLLLSARDWRFRDMSSGGLMCKINIRDPASGHPRKISTADGKRTV